MSDYQPKSPEALFAELKDAVRGVAEQQMPSLRIALDVEPREFELDYSGGTLSLSTPDGSPVHPGIRHIPNFWMKMLRLPAAPASIHRLHARLLPGGPTPLARSPLAPTLNIP